MLCGWAVYNDDNEMKMSFKRYCYGMLDTRTALILATVAFTSSRHSMSFYASLDP